MTTELPHIIWLDDVHPKHVSLVGYKALNLAMAKRLEQPVMKGFVITTAAYQLALEQTGLHPAQLPHMSYDEALDAARTIQHYLFKQAVPSPVLTELRAAYRELFPDKPGALVLRPSMSSGHGADFAKRLRPILGVKSLIDFEKALKMAWAYLWLDDIIQYRFSEERLHKNWVDAAVLVQVLETPYASGSLLTYAPQANDQSFVIEAARGLNEAVSRGVMLPDHLVWQRETQTVTQRQIAEKPLRFVFAEPWAVAEVPIDKDQRHQAAISDAEVGQLATMAEALLKGYNCPLEIEWFKGPQGFVINQLMAIQAPTSYYTEEVQWDDLQQKIPYFEKPFSPLGWSLWEPVLNSILPHALEAADIHPEPQSHWVQLNNDRPMLNPLFMAYLDQRWQDVWTELAEQSVYQRYPQVLRQVFAQQQVWYRAYRQLNDTMRQAWEHDYSTWGVKDLLDTLDQFMTLAQDFMTQALHVRSMNHVISVLFVDFAQQNLPADYDYRLLFQNLDNRHSEALRYLERLRQEVLATPELLELFKSANQVNASAFYLVQQLMLKEPTRQWLDQALDQLSHLGFDKVHLEPLYSSFLDAPQMITQTLLEAINENRAFWDENQTQERQDLTDTLMMSFTWQQTLQKFAFVTLLHLSQSYQSTVAEEPYYLNMLMPRLRSLLLAMSRYLPLDSPQDIFYLKISEIREMTQNTMNAYKIKALREFIQSRKYKRRIAHRLGTEDKNRLEAVELSGYAASQGEALGKVRCIRRSEDLKYLQAGEIIVTDYFEPFWEQALTQAGGLILELGGVLSHGAMLARQYQLPAAAGVKGALTRLKDGLIVRLDGNTGNIQGYQAESLERSEAWVTSE